MNNKGLVDELKFLVESLNDSMPGGTSSRAVMEAAIGLMIVRRLDAVLAEAADGGGGA